MEKQSQFKLTTSQLHIPHPNYYSSKTLMPKFHLFKKHLITRLEIRSLKSNQNCGRRSAYRQSDRITQVIS